MELTNFVELFAQQFEDTDVSEITATTDFQNLDEWDSLMALTIIAFAKTKFQKSINASEVRSCHSVDALYNLIKSK